MERRKPLPRRTPLSALTQLKRTGMKRKATKAQAGWAKAVRQVKERSGGLCEAHTPLCTGIGQQTHHKLKRSQGGQADPAMLLHICNHCDVWIENNTGEAYRLGMLLHRWDVEQ